MANKCGKIRTSYTATGLPRYGIEVRHEGLSKYQFIRGDNEYVVEQKAQATMRQWDDMWDRKKQAEENRRQIEDKKDLAAHRTEEAKAALEALENVLSHTLQVDDTVDWESLKNLSDYARPKPAKPSMPEKPRPQPPLFKEPRKPLASDFAPQLGILDLILDYIFSSRRADKERVAQESFKRALKKRKQDRVQAVRRYNKQVEEYNKTVKELAEKHNKRVKKLAEDYDRSVAAWQQKRTEYLQRRDQANAAVDQKRQKYTEGEPEAIHDYCDMVLSNSQYPDYFPQSYEIDYNPENKILIVEYELPSIDSLPTVREVKYVQSKDEFEEKHISDAELRRRYDKVLYQMALRTIHELYEADTIDGLASIVFNGYVNSVDQATGQQIYPCVLSVQANKDEFAEISLAAIDPKACFKKLKGVGSSKLHSMTPVAPLLRMDREDGRFVEGRAVVDGIAEGDNLAAMDWEDFEHLIRELFEQEFARAGGEVKITQASRDGGVDAIVFDPDPLRGGKIVIQAKRYTNTVGVSAVRDLYGTVMNEGANKGILVSTSDYGPDAYKFAKGKPLVLFNGGELLHLLQKHGHRAKIDLAEAKRLLSEKESE